MGAQLGHKVNEKKAAKWITTLAPALLPGEEVLAVLKCNNMRPTTEGIAVTNFRLGGISLNGWSVEFPFDTPFTMLLDEKKETAQVTVDDSAQVPADIKTRRAEMLFKMVQKEDHGLLSQTISQALAAFDSSLYRATQQGVDSIATAASARTEAAARGEWPESTRIVGSLSKKASLAVLRQCHREDENPWLILVAGGAAGVLAAWDDRLAIIKTGAMTSMLAGSLGGERTATFHFVDITGLEYNSGMLNGVLEVLTPSHAGGVTKDFWASGENDPFKQSNTLPLSKAEFNTMAKDIAQLRSRIAAAKQPTIVMQQPAPAPVTEAAQAPLASGMASQLAELASLRDAGVLTEEEFAAAKQRVIAG